MSAPPNGRPPLRIAPVTAPTLASVKPLPPATAAAIDPYRVLFPLGAAGTILGALVWLAPGVGRTGWPALAHMGLMLEGFEAAFVCGFLLTAMPAFTHGARCGPGELVTVSALVALVAPLHLAGVPVAAHASAGAALAFTLVTLGRRVRLGAAAPPEEFALVGLGLLLGIAGTTLAALAAAGIGVEPVARFGEHVLARGMLLAIVLGLGGLLVPTFAMLPDPLRITGVARAGQRGPRRAFVLGVAALVVGALLAEAAGHARAAAFARLAAGAASTLLAWKLWRLPARAPRRLPWALWSAGACVLAGLAGAAVLPAHVLAAWHLVFAGGFGLLTLAIGTRVVVSHGGHPPADEPRVLGPVVLAALAAAVLARVAAGEADPRALLLLRAAAALWAIAWLAWLVPVLPRVVRTKRPMVHLTPPPARR